MNWLNSSVVFCTSQTGMNMQFLLFLEANLLPITFLYYESVSTLMHDINNDKVPANMLTLFQKTSDIHSYNTLSSTSVFYTRNTKQFFLSVRSKAVE